MRCDLRALFKFDRLEPKDITTASIHICKAQQFFNILFFWRVVSFFSSLTTCVLNIVLEYGFGDGYDDNDEGDGKVKRYEFFKYINNLCFVFLAIYFFVCTISFTSFLLFVVVLLCFVVICQDLIPYFSFFFFLFLYFIITDHFQQVIVLSCLIFFFFLFYM